MVGAPVEREIGDSISRLMKEPVGNLIGELDLGTVKALLRRSDLVICNDSGARHIAAAFAVPSIVLFGPTPLEKTNLNLEHVRIFETELPCRPCYERECPIDHACMTRTRPESVIDAARGVLGIALE
jgi:heptosyltransferase-2